MKRKKRKKPQTTLQWSMELMREEGYKVAKTEHYNKFAGFRQDLFHFADALALDKLELVAIQSSTIGDVNVHLQKLAGIEEVYIWLAVPSRRLEVHGWGLQGARGERKLRVVRRIDVTAELLKPYANTGEAAQVTKVNS